MGRAKKANTTSISLILVEGSGHSIFVVQSIKKKKNASNQSHTHKLPQPSYLQWYQKTLKWNEKSLLIYNKFLAGTSEHHRPNEKAGKQGDQASEPGKLGNKLKTINVSLDPDAPT